MNRVFFALVAIAFVVAAWAQITWAPAISEQPLQATATDGGALFLGGKEAAWFNPAGTTEGERWHEVPAPPEDARRALAKLPAGGVLAVGKSSARFDPTRQSWQELDAPVFSAPSATALPDGRVLVVDGVSTAVFDPSADTWKSAGDLPTDPGTHRAVATRWGAVVIAGERSLIRDTDGTWTDLQRSVQRPAVALLEDDSVLVLGTETSQVWGADGSTRDVEKPPLEGAIAPVPGGAIVASGKRAARFDSTTGKWIDDYELEISFGPPLLVAVGSRALLAGGRNQARLFEPGRNAWTKTAPPTPMELLAAGMIDSAGAAVTLAIGLIGVMTLFLGLMKVAEAGGMLTIIAKLIRPMMVRLFPDVPADHPAMGAMILNMAANALGLGNAATPFGIRAMQELNKLNPYQGTATNAMALFLAINTSSVTLLPTGVIALRAAVGSKDAAGILPTTLFATICSTTVAIVATKLYQRFAPFEPVAGSSPSEGAPDAAPESVEMPDTSSAAAYPGWVSALALLGVVALVPLAIVFGQSVSPWIIPGLMIGLLAFGFFRKVRVYEVFVEGAKDGFQVAVKIIPYLVAILVAVAMFRASGALHWLVTAISPVTELVGLPGEALPMALLRPLSGSGAYGVLSSIISDPTVGPDSYTGYLVSTFQGSTETTFYVLAVYFGAVQIRKTRHALPAALTADAAGIAGAVLICWLLYG